MKKTKLIIQILALAPVVFIPAIVFMVATLILQAEEDNFKAAIQQVESDFIENEKSRIRSKVNNMVDLVAYRQSVINQNLHSRIKNRVQNAQKIALALHDFYQDKMPEAELKRLIIESLRSVQWNHGESYIWIIDLDGTVQLAPKYLRHLENRSVLDFEDENGRKFIREEIAIVKRQGQGFLWDTFTKPGQPNGQHFDQLAYVHRLGLYNWYLGSAEFLDTATKRTNAHLLEAINQVGKGGSDYVFVVDQLGNLLLNYARPDIVGRNMSETSDKKIHQLYQKILKAGETPLEEFITYNWLNPKTGMVDAKMAYVKNVPGSNWVIGSGFYPTMLEQGYEAQKQRLTTQYKQKIQHFNTLTWLSVIGAVLFAGLLSVMFYRALIRFQNNLLDSNDHLKELNLELESVIIEKGKELEKASQILRELKMTDSLTQLPNRSYILKRLNEEMRRANRYGSNLSLILFEIDNLEKLVDRLEATDYDRLIVEISSVLKSRLRNVDLIGRLGNEDFLVVMPEANLAEASHSAQRIRDAISQKLFLNGVEVSLSAGCTLYQQQQTLAELLKQLDSALFKERNLQDSE